MNTFVVVVWLGGMTPAYRHARANGESRLMSVFNAIAWPADVGWHLAQRFCADHKE